MKKEILQKFIAHFETELNALIASAKAAHFAATHEESRAEDRHDTFAIEQSYLAAGQAVRVQDLRASFTELNDLISHLKTTPDTAIDLSSLVTLKSGDKTTYSLIVRFGGGTQVEHDGLTISLVSPTSPLGEAMLGLAAGDDFVMESRAGSRSHDVISVQ